MKYPLTLNQARIGIPHYVTSMLPTNAPSANNHFYFFKVELNAMITSTAIMTSHEVETTAAELRKKVRYMYLFYSEREQNVEWSAFLFSNFSMIACDGDMINPLVLLSYNAIESYNFVACAGNRS